MRLCKSFLSFLVSITCFHLVPTSHLHRSPLELALLAAQSFTCKLRVKAVVGLQIQHNRHLLLPSIQLLVLLVVMFKMRSIHLLLHLLCLFLPHLALTGSVASPLPLPPGPPLELLNLLLWTLQLHEPVLIFILESAL